MENFFVAVFIIVIALVLIFGTKYLFKKEEEEREKAKYCKKCRKLLKENEYNYCTECAKLEHKDENSIASAVKVLGVITIIGGIIGSFVASNFLVFVGGLVSGIFILGFGEIIQKLHIIANNKKD